MTVGTVHLAATSIMVGVILFVQLVHYPLMGQVGTDTFARYQAGHTARTGLVVMPPMIAELASATWLAIFPPASDLRTVAWTGLILVGAIWASTFLLQVPAHQRLSRGFHAPTHRRLVRTNWLRTVAWIARIPVALALI